MDDFSLRVLDSADDNDGSITGTAFTDGSLKHKHHKGGHAGWGVVERSTESPGSRVAYFGPSLVDLPV